MTAPDQCCSNSESSCQGGAVHTKTDKARLKSRSAAISCRTLAFEAPGPPARPCARCFRPMPSPIAALRGQVSALLTLPNRKVVGSLAADNRDRQYLANIRGDDNRR